MTGTTRAQGMLAREIDDDLASNPLTLAEVLVVPARDGRREQVKAAFEDLEFQQLRLRTDAASGWRPGRALQLRRGPSRVSNSFGSDLGPARR